MLPPLTIGFPRGSVTWDFTRPYLVGVVNVTPDSFSDGGRLDDLDAALAFALQLIDDGADMLDVGGESTRPGAAPVDAATEIARVAPLLRALSERASVPISIDTTKARVAHAALAAGASIVNDVSGGLFDPEMVHVAAAQGAAYVLGHLRGRAPAEVHARLDSPRVDDVVRELGVALEHLPKGLRERTICDPGLGFGKSAEVNLALCARAGTIAARLGRPVMLGPSRKRFLGSVSGRSVEERDFATAGASLAIVRGGAHFVRVHNVRGVRDALAAYQAINEASA